MPLGYPRFPTVHDQTLVFTAEDELWSAPTEGGAATRLTSGKAAASFPAFSPDGSLIAYVGHEDGPSDVYLVSSKGGEARRLTYTAGEVTWVGWEADGRHIRFAGSLRTYHPRDMHLWRIAVDGGEPEPLPYGRGSSIVTDETGLTVISRGHTTRSAAYQKRYRGGTAGHLWIDSNGSGNFTRMTGPAGFVESPQILNGRVYFLSDHEGVGNVYSYLPNGSDLRRHSDHSDYYARGLSGDHRRLTYFAGGRLYVLDPQEDSPRTVDVEIAASHRHRNRKYVDAERFLHGATLTPDGSRLTVQTRGKLYTMDNWDGPVWQHGVADGTAYRLPTWLAGGTRLIAAASDRHRDEVLVELDTVGTTPPVQVTDGSLGRALEITSSPIAEKIALSTHTGKVVIVDLSGPEVETTVVAQSDYGTPAHLTFSPDGKWLAFARPRPSPDGSMSTSETSVSLVDLSTGREHPVAVPVRSDSKPSFDPDGRYLYFVGDREFNAVYQDLDFELAFTWGSRPYAVVLDGRAAPPFLGGEPESDTDGDNDTSDDLTVDTDGLSNRIVPFPVEVNRFKKVLGIKGKVLTLTNPPRPVDSSAIFDPGGVAGVLESVDLTTGKTEKVADGVSDVWLSADASRILYKSGKRLRVLKAGEKAPDGDAAGRDTGWIDLGRIKVSIAPKAEWPQMFAEAWRLEREHFWLADMGGIDWDEVFNRYAPLAERVTTRSEFSDLMWELQGELANSHAYEMLGDYPSGDRYRQGFLGVEYSVDTDSGAYRIARILEGDRWEPTRTSPLHRPGVNVSIGDELLAVNGQTVDRDNPPGERLANLGGQEVFVTVRTGDEEPRTVKVKALDSERAIRYRDWVEENRRIVHEATDGKVGYVHIPDMGADGFAEFHRSFLAEHLRPALVVDLRFNGGGHVSPLLLDRLSRPRTGSVFARHQKPGIYPTASAPSVLVGLINENAGSDGDLGSHHFRARGLGPLIGTRTWGGTVGINVRHFLADNTLVTQPEFAMHLADNGWGLENHGVDPDIEVDYTPQDHAAGVDPQLRRGIEEALARLEDEPSDRFSLHPFPSKRAPQFPPRT